MQTKKLIDLAWICFSLPSLLARGNETVSTFRQLGVPWRNNVDAFISGTYPRVRLRVDSFVHGVVMNPREVGMWMACGKENSKPRLPLAKSLLIEFLAPVSTTCRWSLVLQ